eukprot:CAMPEP_0197415806 /NCGR_PEP_ID=MMETSP1170-20131217/2239_1 /TAXON_ID=54406 /ORGANISM="Sarcinochrysis sp, Strain CCMP770" /LENGTH=153 /DNA_ID=CAMNT_0042942647 /DNA_START=51 /DNA_END=509 /DNA_ORIENTATION=-
MSEATYVSSAFSVHERWSDHLLRGQAFLTGRPFSATDLSLGAGGTLPTQARICLPPTMTVQVPQSPFLQFVGTLRPSFRQAASIDDPAGTSTRRPFAVNGVWAETIVDRLPDTEGVRGAIKAPQPTRARVKKASRTMSSTTRMAPVTCSNQDG